MSNADRKRKRPSKKTEMLEVRVSPEEKAAFLDACRDVGRSASEVIRDAMRAYSNFGPMTRLPRSGFVLVSAFIGASAGAYILVTHLNTEQTEDAVSAISYQQFREIDFDRNDRLTRQEFMHHAGDVAELLSVGEVAAPVAAARRSNLLGAVFGGYNINLRNLLIDTDGLSAECIDGAQQAYRDRKLVEFGTLDHNSDGIVTPAEFAEDQRQKVASSFGYSDLNDDGVLTIEDSELRAARDQGRAADSTTTFREPEPAYIALCRETVGEWNAVGITSSSRGEMTADDYWAIHARFDSNGDNRVDFSEYVTRVSH